MGAFQNIGVSDYLKRYGWKYGIQRGAFTAFPFHVVNDYSGVAGSKWSGGRKRPSV